MLYQPNPGVNFNIRTTYCCPFSYAIQIVFLTLILSFVTVWGQMARIAVRIPYTSPPRKKASNLPSGVSSARKRKGGWGSWAVSPPHLVCFPHPQTQIDLFFSQNKPQSFPVNVILYVAVTKASVWNCNPAHLEHIKFRKTVHNLAFLSLAKHTL